MARPKNTTWRCSRCGETDLTKFTKNGRSWSGLSSYCRRCQSLMTMSRRRVGSGFSPEEWAVKKAEREAKRAELVAGLTRLWAIEKERKEAEKREKQRLRSLLPPRCPTCGDDNPERFQKNKARPNGLQIYCRRCHNDIGERSDRKAGRTTPLSRLLNAKNEQEKWNAILKIERLGHEAGGNDLDFVHLDSVQLHDDDHVWEYRDLCGVGITPEEMLLNVLNGDEAQHEFAKEARAKVSLYREVV